MQAEHKSHMIEVAGKIASKPMAILIDSGASHSYIAPNMVERCHLKRSKLYRAGLVQWLQVQRGRSPKQ